MLLCLLCCSFQYLSGMGKSEDRGRGGRKAYMVVIVCAAFNFMVVSLLF